MPLSFQGFKDAFFTSAAIQKIIGPAEKKALGKMGGYVRRTAKNSLKYGDKSSAAGQTPTVHRFMKRQKTNKKTGAVTTQSVSPLKEFLFYAFDAYTRSTVVGPAIFGSSARSTTSSKAVPGTLEKGGTVTIKRDRPIAKSGRKISQRQKDAFLAKVGSGEITRPSRVEVTSKQYAPRPFMVPALAKSLPKFASYFSRTS